MKRLSLLLGIISLLLATATAQIQYATVECSNAPDFTVVFVTSISNNGTMVGAYYSATDPLWHALIIKDGECTPLAPDTVLGTKASGAWSINEAGDIVGAWFHGPPLAPPAHGFLLTKKGVLKMIAFPTADSTGVQAINQSGTMAGQWEILDSLGNSVSAHGFLLKDGEFMDIVATSGAAFTSVAGINARGDYVGYWGPDMTFTQMHGFLVHDGNYVQIDAPFAGVTSTMTEAINDKGDVAGAYSTATEPRRGFVKIGSNFVPVDYPGAVMTNINGINNKGQVVGWYFNQNFELHGFVAETKE